MTDHPGDDVLGHGTDHAGAGGLAAGSGGDDVKTACTGCAGAYWAGGADGGEGKEK